METRLTEIIEHHEMELLRYKAEIDSINAKTAFMSEHKFQHELVYLQNKKSAMLDIFFDYKKIIEDLRDVLNALNS